MIKYKLFMFLAASSKVNQQKLSLSAATMIPFTTDKALLTIRRELPA